MVYKEEGGNPSEQPSRCTAHQNNRRHSESFKGVYVLAYGITIEVPSKELRF